MRKLLLINALIAAMASYGIADETETEAKTTKRTTTERSYDADSGEIENEQSTTVETQSTASQEEVEEREDNESSVILSIAGLATAPEENLDNDDTDYNYGGAILVESNVNDIFGVETGVMYVRRQYVANVAGAKIAAEVDRLHIPVTARIWATDFLSLAAGPYIAFSVGDVDSEVIAGDTTVNYETKADDNMELGLDLAATLNIAVNDKSGIFIEGRYSQPFEEESEEDYDKVTALAGFKIDM